MLRLYTVRLTGGNAPLRTAFDALPAAYAQIGYLVTLLVNYPVSDAVTFAENRIYFKIKVLNFHIINFKNDTDFSGIVRVNI